MNARERIVEQFEVSQMAKNGVYLFTMDKGLEDDLNNRIISDAVKNAFKTNGVLLSKKTSITKENEDKMVIGDKEKKNIFFVRTRKEDNELNVYNNEYNIKKIELPKNVIIRTETVEEVESTKQAKIRKEGMMPPKPEEGIGKNGRKIAKRAEETRVIWIEKQAKIREEGLMPPKPEEEIGKNGRKIAKIPEEKRITVMKGSLNSDIAKALDLLEEKIPIYKKLDGIYYIEMAVGGIIFVSTVIFYQVLGLMAIPLIIFGLGIFFTSFASKRKINRIRKEYGI